jgi:adenine-specific DNA glycosylase
MPHPTKPVSKLAKLAGVGPATASAVAAAASPEQYPFFDELVAAQLPGLGEVKWTLGYYARYADILRTAASEMGSDWTPAMLERALWAHAAGKTGADRG